MASLDSYSKIIDGWAQRIANDFALNVALQNDKAWREHSQEIGRELRNMTDNASVGQVMKSIVARQVQYIKSLPLEAAERIYDIQNKAIEAIATGSRPEPFAKEIAATGEVAASRARLIARTEIGRASVALTQARSLAIGSTGYIWRTANDSDVRHSHHKMEGKFVAWEKPPTLDGMTGHAGALPNCRCYCEVIFPRVPLATKKTA